MPDEKHGVAVSAEPAGAGAQAGAGQAGVGAQAEGAEAAGGAPEMTGGDDNALD